MNTTAHDRFRVGDITGARHRLAELPEAGIRQTHLLARIDYLEGRYNAAIGGFTKVIGSSRLRPIRRYHARRQLSLAYYQTNQFDLAARLPLRDPISRLMRAFSTEPNRITWGGTVREELPFLQEESWELPRIEVSVNGELMAAKVDTGGDLLSLPWPVAERLGIEPVVTTTGTYAGGHRARTAHGILDRLGLGRVVVGNVPISINAIDHPVVGTGLLRQFAPTFDFPGGKLVLAPRSQPNETAVFPFLLAGTHLLIAAGELNGMLMRFLIDSGLEISNGGGFLAPESSLRTVGIEIPKTTPIEGISGAGATKLKMGRFSVRQLGLGHASRGNQVGLTGIFPKQLTRPSTLGFPIDGLVSHNFLRHYRWTIDFDLMGMTLATP